MINLPRTAACAVPLISLMMLVLISLVLDLLIWALASIVEICGDERLRAATAKLKANLF